MKKQLIRSIKKILQTTVSLVAFITSCMLTGYSQEGFVFQNPVRFSGTDLQVNARYRFSNVTTGTDALVTITAVNGGAYLTALDDAAFGYTRAFQPIVHAPANSNGYVQFRIDFVNTGTSTAKVLTQIPVTLIDVDAATFNNEVIYEFDEISTYAGYSIDYDPDTELDISFASGIARGINRPGTEYLGIDSLKTKVMYTVVNYNRSTITIRLGSVNNTNQFYNRLKSVYFKSLPYPFSVLKTTLTNFKAIESPNATTLDFELAAHSGIRSVVIEKGELTSAFRPLKEMTVTSNKETGITFQFEDYHVATGDIYYRLKLLKEDGNIEYSRVLTVTRNTTRLTLEIYPTLVHSSATLLFNSDKNTKAVLQIIDTRGILVYQEELKLQNGNNSFRIGQLERLRTGSYVVILNAGNRLYHKEVIKL